MHLYTLQRQQQVSAELDRVFAFFALPENLAEVTPPSLAFQILTPCPIKMREGALIDYCIHQFGVPMRWTTLITHYEPPHCFVDEQLKGPYSFWHHTHTFAALDGGGTIIGDHVRYAMPFGPLGRLIHAAYVGRQLKQIFAHRQRVIEQMFGRAV